MPKVKINNTIVGYNQFDVPPQKSLLIILTNIINPQEDMR